MLIHVGYQKCASTWLQLHLFNNAEAGFGALNPRGKIENDLVRPHALEFDPERCRQSFDEEMIPIRAARRIIVLSNEGLTGAGQTGGWEAKEMAERLVRTFPEGKVLIIIREQRNMIYSSYNQYLKGSCTVTAKEFIEPPTPPMIAPFFSKVWLRYDLLIDLYHRLFGRENVLVLPFELFQAEAHEFVRRIVEFAGARVPADLPYDRREKTSWPALPLLLKRPFNAFMYRHDTNGYCNLKIPFVWVVVKYLLWKVVNPALPAAFSRPIERRWRRQIADMVEGYYAESNRRTSELIDFNLSEFGYEVAPAEARPSGRETAAPSVAAAGVAGRR